MTTVTRTHAASAEMLSTIIDNIHEMVAYLDPQFNFIRVNKAYATADQKTVDFFPGKNHFDLYPNAENETIFRRVVETGEPYVVFNKPFEYAEAPERGISYWDWSIYPVHREGGEIDGLLLTLNNVTERVQREQSLLDVEKKFHLIYDSTNDAIFIHDSTGHFIEVNRAACVHLGYSRDELLSLTLADIDTPEAQARMPELSAKLQSAGHLIAETSHIRKDGTIVPVEISARIIDFDGRPAVLSLARDISWRKQAEEALALSRASLQALIDANHESAVLIDIAGRVLAINDVGAKRFGHSAQDLLGKNIYDYMPQELAIKRKNIINQVLHDKEPVSFEDQRAGYDFRTSIYPITTADGNVRQLAVYATDVTPQRRASGVELMLHALDRLVLSGEPQETLLNFLCHEMVRIFHLPLAWVGRKERDGSVNILAGTGQAQSYLDNLRQIGVRWDQSPQGSGPVGNAIRSGIVQRLEVSSPQFSPWREAAANYDFKAVIALPLIIRGEVFGALTIYTASTELLRNPMAREWFDSIADRLRLTLENMMDHAQLRLLSTALGAAGNGVMITDRDGRIQWVNEAFAQMSGYSSNELMGHTPRILKSGEHGHDYYQTMWRTLHSGLRWSSDTIERARNGTNYTVRQTITPIFSDSGEISHFIAIHEDITRQKADEERIQFLAHHDQLTQLPNRKLFQDRLHQALALSLRNSHEVGLLFLDLDRFKSINDTLGHDAGDLLLQQVAERLTHCLRESDTVARIGGDEFTVLLPMLHDRHECQIVAEKIIQQFSEPFVLNGTAVETGTSIGIAICPQDGSTNDELLRQADQAMYRAKNAGGGYRFASE